MLPVNFFPAGASGKRFAGFMRVALPRAESRPASRFGSGTSYTALDCSRLMIASNSQDGLDVLFRYQKIEKMSQESKYRWTLLCTSSACRIQPITPIFGCALDHGGPSSRDVTLTSELNEQESGNEIESR